MTVEAFISSTNIFPFGKRPAHTDEEKVEAIQAEVEKKKAQLDNEFRQYAEDLTSNLEEKPDGGLLLSERAMGYRTEAKIRKRYWKLEWKKLRLEWKADRRIAKLRGEPVSSYFSLKKEPASPHSGLTLWEQKDRWHANRERDLAELQADYEQGRPVQYKYYRAPNVAAVAEPPMFVPATESPRTPVPPPTVTPPARASAAPPIVTTPPGPSRVTAPPRAPVTSPPMKQRPAVPPTTEKPVETTSKPVVAAPAAVSQQRKEAAAVAENAGAELQQVMGEIQGSMKQLQDSLDRALRLTNEQMGDINRERAKLTDKRSELAARNGQLKEGTAALEKDRQLFEAEQSDYGKKALLRDQKKERLSKEEVALVADRNAFEEQVERWEVQQRQINAKIREFHETAAELSGLRSTIETEKADIDKEDMRISKGMDELELKRGELDTQRKELKARTETIDQEISGLETQTTRALDHRNEVVQQRADLAKRQKEFVDHSLEEWKLISAKAEIESKPYADEKNKNDNDDNDQDKGNDKDNEGGGHNNNATIEPTKTEASPIGTTANEESVRMEVNEERKDPTAVEDDTPPKEEENPARDEKVNAVDPVDDETQNLSPEYKPEAPIVEPVSDEDRAEPDSPLAERHADDLAVASHEASENEQPLKGKLSGIRNRIRNSVSSVKERLKPKEEDVEPTAEPKEQDALPETPQDQGSEIPPAAELLPLASASSSADEPVLHGAVKSENIRDILYETKENIKDHASSKFGPAPYYPGGFGSAVKQEFARARDRRNAVKAKKQEMLQEMALAKGAAAQEIASLLKSRNQTNLIKSDDAVVAKLVNKLVDDRMGHDIIQQYKRAQKEATQDDGSTTLGEGMQVSMKNMRIGMSNAGGRMRHAAGKAKCVGLTCTEGAGRLVSAAARNRLTMQQQQLPEQTFELR